jgi:hypothetical protein
MNFVINSNYFARKSFIFIPFFVLMAGKYYKNLLVYKYLCKDCKYLFTTNRFVYQIINVPAKDALGLPG